MEPYIPQSLPLDLSVLNWQQIALKLSEASSELSYYNGVLGSIVNPSIFLSPLETKEAVFSSRIEGTVTTVDEILKYEVDLKPENRSKENDIIEVLNYRSATRLAKDWLTRGMPFNITLICAIQKELMQGVRGKDKHPGELRKDQVWIGPKYSSMEEATYIPPEPLGLQDHLSNLIAFMDLPDQEVLLQAAIMHAQFELIHPFDDGNGLTGRILIPLYLWCKKRISAPMFYLSEFFDENRDQYINSLQSISEEKDWQRWILFFLEAISIQSKRNSHKANQVLDLYKSMKSKIGEITKSPYSNKILDTLFINPLFQPPDFIKLSGIDPKSARRMIAKLKSENILSSIREHSGTMSEVLVFSDLYNLIR